jgi:solute carrier family 25 iron transporter 28/37
VLAAQQLHVRAGETSAGAASTSAASPSSPAPAPLHAGGGALVGADGLTFWQHMLAGALAGTVEHLAMFPLDTVKTRMQAVPHGGASIAHSLNYGTMRAAVDTVLRREGVRGLYRGVDAMALGAGPAHAFYFAIYEVRRRSRLTRLSRSSAHARGADVAAAGSLPARRLACGALALQRTSLAAC